MTRRGEAIPTVIQAVEMMHAGGCLAIRRPPRSHIEVLP